MTDPRIVRLLTLALDSGATEGESVAAMAGVARIARVNKWRLPDLLRAMGGATQRPSAPPRPGCLDVVMPFGKHKGRTLGEIGATHLSYLEWAAENLTDARASLVESIEATLEYYTRRSAWR